MIEERPNSGRWPYRPRRSGCKVIRRAHTSGNRLAHTVIVVIAALLITWPGMAEAGGQHQVSGASACKKLKTKANGRKTGITVCRLGKHRPTAAQRTTRLFSDPRAVTVDSHGNVYVSDTQKGEIIKLSPAGQVIATYGKPGLGAGSLKWVDRIRIDANGNMYLVDEEAGISAPGTGHLLKLSPDGKLLARWPIDHTLGLALDSQGNIYLPNYQSNTVEKLSPNGTRLATWYGAGQVAFKAPEDLAVDAEGNIYVVDTINERIVKLSPDGHPLAEWGKFGNAPGQFENPEGVAVDVQGNVYVADGGNERIEKFSSSGQFLAQWGTKGTGRGQFYDPFDIAVDGAGDIYITDPIPLNGAHGDNRLQEFSPAGKVIAVWK